MLERTPVHPLSLHHFCPPYHDFSRSKIQTSLLNLISLVLRSSAGINLAPKSEKTRWGEVHKTIGCGFDPNKKTVFFTVDSSLVHVVRCTSEAFSHSLFPAIAANADVWVSVNLGERPFSYSNRPEGVSLSSPLLLEPSPRAGYYEYSRGPFSVKWEDLELFEISLSR